MLTDHQWGLLAFTCISKEMLQISILYMGFKIASLVLQPHLPGINELNKLCTDRSLTRSFLHCLRVHPLTAITPHGLYQLAHSVWSVDHLWLISSYPGINERPGGHYRHWPTWPRVMLRRSTMARVGLQLITSSEMTVNGNLFIDFGVTGWGYSTS